MRARIGSASRPAVGQTVCGDAFEITPFAHGITICLADGLGHGPEARAAADVACRYARAHADEPLEALMRGMDRELAGTRGAAVSTLVLEPAARRALFAGVGNVELRTVARAHISPPTMPGILGHRVRRMRVWEYPLAEGDMFVLMSDGISSRFELEPLARLEAQALAEHVVATHHKAHDDACCVVVRFGEDA